MYTTTNIIYYYYKYNYLSQSKLMALIIKKHFLFFYEYAMDYSYRS